MKVLEICVDKLKSDLREAVCPLVDDHNWSPTEYLAIAITLDNDIDAFIRTIKKAKEECVDIVVTFNKPSFICPTSSREDYIQMYDFGSNSAGYIGVDHYESNTSHFRQDVTYDDILAFATHHVLYYFSMNRCSQEMIICVAHFVEKLKAGITKPNYSLPKE